MTVSKLLQDRDKDAPSFGWCADDVIDNGVISNRLTLQSDDEFSKRLSIHLPLTSSRYHRSESLQS